MDTCNEVVDKVFQVATDQLEAGKVRLLHSGVICETTSRLWCHFLRCYLSHLLLFLSFLDFLHRIPSPRHSALRPLPTRNK